MKIGFIGLGNLGRAICERLASVDVELIIYNRNKDKIKDLPYEKANTPKELLKECEVIFLCLFDSNAVRDILTQENGLSKYENQIQYNNIIRNFCISLYKICSQYGAHSCKEHNLNIISKYVTSALLNQLCEVIIWYDKALNILNNEKNDSVE